MEIKKNPSVDPKRNSGIYFLVGLVSILLVSYLSIEIKTEDPVIPEEKFVLADNNIDDDEDVIMTMPPEPKLPPPPPPAPEVIQIVKNEIKINEPKIQKSETKPDEAIVIPKATDVGGKQGNDDFDFEGEVPFAVIEDIPLFPGCETVPKSERQNCFQEKMNAHIKKNFEYPRQAAEDEIQGRVTVVFIIDKEGNFTDIKTIGPKNGEDLEKEARRIFSKLPKITPGKQRNKPVKVKYAYPINFKLN